MKPMKTKELVKLLEGLGAQAGHTRGSHQKWTAPGGRSTTIKVGDKEQAPGTLRNIQRHLAAEFGERWIEDEQ